MSSICALHVSAQTQVKDTSFSVKRGLYSSEQNLEITTKTPEATIYYTTDGSTPTTANATVYSEPISISTTTVIRAFAEAPGLTPTNVDTHTYLFLADIIAQPATIDGYPSPNYGTGGGGPTVTMDYEMDPDITNSPAYSEDILKAFSDIPAMCLSVDPDEIFGNDNFYDGENVEKQAALEILYPSDPSANEKSEVGVESHSHKRLKRSLRLNFRSEYGDAKWKTSLFRKAPFNASNRVTPNEVDRVILRAGNNRAWSRTFSREKTTYALDEFARTSQQAMGGDGMRGAFVQLFINGIYWGLYNPVIRADTFYTSEAYGGSEADWFAVNHGGDLKGNDDRYDYLRGDLKNKEMSVAANYQELSEHLDIDNFIDYLLLHWYTNTGDWPQNNWYGGLRNASSLDAPLPMKFFAWDGEWSWDLPHSSIRNIAPDPDDTWVHPDFRSDDDKNSSRVIPNLFNSAKDNELFIRRLGDRAYRHFANDGALSDSASMSRFNVLTQYLNNAVVAESARWGDALDTDNNGSPLFTRDDQWNDEIFNISEYIDGRASKALAVLRAEGYYPEIDPPVYSQYGGEIVPGFTLDMSPPVDGLEIYYTLDGSDPVDNGILLTALVTLTESTRVLARTKDGDEWSALADAVFTIPMEVPLLVSELHYHPSEATSAEVESGHSGENDFEYLELHNPGSEAIDLSGYQFTSGITLTLPDASIIPPGETAVIVGDPECFARRHGAAATILGNYSGKLSNDGERLVLTSSLGQNIIDFTYNDIWHQRSDGDDYSLTLLDTTSAGANQTWWNSPNAWVDSGVPGGTPGAIMSEGLNYPDWLERHGLDFGPGERDSDADGTPDLQEYLFGTHPLRKDLPLISLTDDGVQYTLRTDRADAMPIPEISENLQPLGWTTGDTESSTSSGYETHTLVWPNVARHFFRLRVIRP